MENSTKTDGFDEQSKESDIPAKVVTRPCGCVSCLTLVLYFIVFLFIGLYFADIFHPSALHPMRYSFSLVETRDMEDTLCELVGEWVIELPFPNALGDFSDMKGWQQTKIILNADHTCEIQNLTLHMTDVLHCGQQRPEWVGKTLTGTWRPLPQHCTGHINKVFAGIEISWDPYDDATERLLAEGYTNSLGLLMVWKRKWGGEDDPYRLRFYDGDILSSSGIILKRMSLPAEHLYMENDESN